MLKRLFSTKIVPNCRACKFYDNGLCKKRYDSPLYIDENKIMNPSAELHNDCRKSELKCGKNGKYFIKKDTDIHWKMIEDKAIISLMTISFSCASYIFFPDIILSNYILFSSQFILHLYNFHKICECTNIINDIVNIPIEIKIHEDEINIK
jgi:hypothetical protein